MKQYSHLTLYLCSLCNKEYPPNIEKCPLDHCKFCGDTSLEIVPVKIVKDPIFLLINTLFGMLIVFAFFNQEIENIGGLFAGGVFMYVFGLAMYLGVSDRRSNYYCKNCRTTIRTALVDAQIGEYVVKPEKKETIQSPVILKTHHAKELIMILGSAGSILSIFLIFFFQQ